MNEFSRTFHETTDKLERLYMTDFETRKNQYQKSDTLNKALNFDEHTEINLANVDSIFDEIVREENPGLIRILTKIPNLLMLAVIGLCVMLHMQLSKLANKNRVD